MQSIENTTRKVTNISVNLPARAEPATFKSIISIIKKFSATIQYLKIHGNSGFYGIDRYMEMCEILSIVPSVVHLVFEDVHVVMDSERSTMCSNEDLHFHFLKTLQFHRCNAEFAALFNMLPAGVLTELSIDQSLRDKLSVLFTRQTNITKLTIGTSKTYEKKTIAANLFDNMKLESLKWELDPWCEPTIMGNILSKQTNLKSLKLMGGVVDENVMNIVVAKLTELQTFAVCLHYTPVEAFKKIRKLNNLNELTLEGRYIHLEAFSAMDNSRITTLDIQ